MGAIISIILAALAAFFFVWFFHWLERYRREFVYLFGCVFGWGVVSGVFATLFLALLVPWNMAFHLESQALEIPRRFILVAPLVEEGLKALAILAVMLMFRKEFSYLPEGMVYGGVIAAGFSATQNAFYLYNAGWVPGGLAGVSEVFLQRVLCGGFTAILCGAGIGAGLSWAQRRPKRWQRYHTALTLWVGVYLCHALRNGLVVWAAHQLQWQPLSAGAIVDLAAWGAALVLAAGILHAEHRRFVWCLSQEVAEGWLTTEQAQLLRRRYWLTRLRTFLPLPQDRTAQVIFLCSELAQRESPTGDGTRVSEANGLSQRLHTEFLKLVSQLSQAS